MDSDQRKYNLFSFGCQMNVSDAEFIGGLLRAKGWEPSEQLDECGLILMNTCVVRDSAEQRAKSRLMQLKPLKQRNESLIIGVVGCLAQKDGQRLLEDFPFVDLAVGTRELHKIGWLVDEIQHTHGQFVCVDNIDQPATLNAEPARGDDLKALLTITYGCNNHCTFCIVPRTRGEEWSRPAQDLTDEVKRLADSGYKEVTLLGQNVNSYHDGAHDFSDLLRKIGRETGIRRIRFMTSNPQDTTDKLLDTIAEVPGICEHVHLPVQAGSNRVLKTMARRYTRERYLELVAGLRQRMPDCAITTDIIVGFPGETYDEFRETYSLAEEVRWDSAFTFIYNVRTGTPAEKMDDPIPLDDKKAWIAELIRLTEKIGADQNKAEIGTVQEVLIEGPSRRDKSRSMGRTRKNKVVILDNGALHRGDEVQVRITGSGSHTLFGSALEGAVPSI